MAVSYYIEGEIGEIKFEGTNKVSFTLIPSQDYRRKEGDCEYALKVRGAELLADLVPMDEFLKEFFVCKNKALASQLSVLKVNRYVVRVEVDKGEEAMPTISVSIK